MSGWGETDVDVDLHCNSNHGHLTDVTYHCNGHSLMQHVNNK